MLNFFTKERVSQPSCKTCCHYGSVSSEDKLNPDKTVTKGRMRYEFCNQGSFYLSDHKPCEFHKEGKRSARIMPPPIPNGAVRRK